MRKLFLSIAVLSALSFSVAAQNAQGRPQEEQSAMTPEQKTDKDLANAAKLLNLNEGQKVKFKQFSLEKNTAIYALKQKAKGADKTTQEGLKAQAQSIREKFLANVRGILNPEQLVKFEEAIKPKEDSHNHHD